MKKSVSIVLTILLLAALFVTAAADDTPRVSLEASRTSVAADSDVTLTLTLSGALKGISSFEYYVHYDPTVMTYKSAEIGTSCTFAAVGTPPDANYDRTEHNAAMTVSAVRFDGDGTFDMAAGTVAVLTFTVKNDAVAGTDCGVALECVAVCDSTFADDAVQVASDVAPTVTVTNVGDANGDGRVDIGDVQWIYVNSGNSDLTAEQITRADIDGNGKVERADAQKLYNEQILGKAAN